MNEEHTKDLHRHAPRARLDSEAGAPLAVADLGSRPSDASGKVVHELTVSDAPGGTWSGRVTFENVRDGRDTPERFAWALLETVKGHEGSPTEVLATLEQPIVLFEKEPSLNDGPVEGDAQSTAPSTGLSEPANGREPGTDVDGTLDEILDTYHLPRVVPFPVKLVIYFVAIGIPVPVLWWLVLPHSVAVVVVLTVLELTIVFGALYRIFLSAELTRLPRRQPVQAPSTKGLDRAPSRR